MAAQERNSAPADVDKARRLICTNLATLFKRGSCTVRVRRLRDEGRVTFQAEFQNRWESTPGMDYHGADASEILGALTAVGTKRNETMHIGLNSSGNHDDVTIGIHKEAVEQHNGNLYQYVYGQLFWD